MLETRLKGFTMMYIYRDLNLNLDAINVGYVKSNRLLNFLGFTV